MRQSLSVLFIVIILISGCRDKVVCPAFQSTYILDDSVRLIYYSYLWKLDKEERSTYLARQRTNPNDTLETPALQAPQTDYYAYLEPYVVSPNEVRKSKYGIVKYEPYWLKNYQLRTAPMENILAPPAIPQPDTSAVDIGDFVASDFSDTLKIADDSLSLALNAESDTSDFVYPSLVIPPPPKPKKETVFLYRYDPEDETLNVEQQYYNKHFGHLLYTTREVPVEQPQVSEPAIQTDTTAVTAGGLKGLFQGKRKKDEPQQAPVIDEVVPDEDTVDDSGF